MVSYRSLVIVPSACTMNRGTIVGIWLRYSCASSPARPLADRFRTELSLLSYGPITRLMPYGASLTGIRCPPPIFNFDGCGPITQLLRKQPSKMVGFVRDVDPAFVSWGKYRFWLHLSPNKASDSISTIGILSTFSPPFFFSDNLHFARNIFYGETIISETGK